MEYSEPELILPALEILEVFPEGLTTTDLMGFLRQNLNPSGGDIVQLVGRNDDHFSQKVRNLTGSHKTLENKGLVTVVDHRYVINEVGRRYLTDHKGTSDALKNQGFDAKDREAIADEDFKDILIEEGATQSVTRNVRERSSKLTVAARAHYESADGKIFCSGCGFVSATAITSCPG